MSESQINQEAAQTDEKCDDLLKRNTQSRKYFVTINNPKKLGDSLVCELP
jgi:hypothetical protein